MPIATPVSWSQFSAARHDGQDDLGSGHLGTCLRGEGITGESAHLHTQEPESAPLHAEPPGARSHIGDITGAPIGSGCDGPPGKRLAEPAVQK
jgi:hypothetical protein